MGLLEIREVRTASADGERLRAATLDAPVAPSQFDVERFELDGWVLGQAVSAVAVELRAGDQVLGRFPVEQTRSDVAASYPEAPSAARSGFFGSVDATHLDPNFQIAVWAMLADDRRHLGQVGSAHQLSFHAARST